jgi:hypothetical protein
MPTLEEIDKDFKAIKIPDALLNKAQLESVIRIRAFNDLKPPRDYFAQPLTAVIRKPLKLSILKHDLAIEFKNLTDTWENGVFPAQAGVFPQQILLISRLIQHSRLCGEYLGYLIPTICR